RCLLSLAIYPFFSSCHCHPQYLPSFPTRRSSDLPRSRRPPRNSSRHPCRGEARCRRCTSSAAPPARLAPRRGSGVCATGSCEERSEEHTSELQSRFDLVCRLLLEKKKITNRTDTH